jgi:hypothetical protein
MVPITRDGPATDRFRPVPLAGGRPYAALAGEPLSAEMRGAAEHAPEGDCVAWGLPFAVRGGLLLRSEAIEVPLEPLTARWLVFLHTSDVRPLEANAAGLVSPMHGEGMLGELAATYVVRYADGSSASLPVRRRFQIGPVWRRWGVNCFEAVAAHKPHPLPANRERPGPEWGEAETRASAGDWARWQNWLWAWENPHPEVPIVGLRLEPGIGVVVLAGLSAGDVSAHPLRWEARRKAILALPEGLAWQPTLDDDGLLAQVQIDLGQVISALPRPAYPQDGWADSYNNQLPEPSANELIVEYAAHPDGAFHLWDGRTVPLAALGAASGLTPVAPAAQRVTLRAVEKGTRRAVAVKLHVHGQAGEYLPPVDRHRIPNPAWFEDYSVDFSHRGIHHTSYIPGETRLDLPLGRVYVEVSKGFEIRPVRQVVEVTPETTEITIEIERVLPWRERGWVTADTHVHFLSPLGALLEGAGEGVNVVNLLASQWGELMTNVGDFDGRNTWGSREAGGDGEHLVRVGTENRQHVMGHISLLGYSGDIIAPMTTGGADESALGDPVGALLTEWARQCRRQGGLVVVPHFPHPRAEHAATIVDGAVDAVEMTSWGNLYAGINPYSLSDWYRYLNCGYLVAAVGGTDKMLASTAIGTVRTYAQVGPLGAFTYDTWMAAVRRAHTFVTYGPLLEFAVDGHPMGSRIALGARGGTVDVHWALASVTVPMSRVELVVNGEIRESLAVDPWRAEGHWSVRVGRSSWLALLVRGHYPDQPEIIAAHSSPVMAEVEGSPFYAAADAVTILEQIEGALAFLDTVGTRAETARYREMRLVLESAHRRLHNRMHALGHYHDHTPEEDHAAHH